MAIIPVVTGERSKVLGLKLAVKAGIIIIIIYAQNSFPDLNKINQQTIYD